MAVLRSAASSVVVICLCNVLVGEAASPRPHIVMILADDYGYAHLGVHRRHHQGPDAEQGRAETHTPTMDKLVDEGILLERHYAYKICSPSRSSLQSGRLAVHVNAVNLGPLVWNPADPVSGYQGVPRNMTGMATKLRDVGYRTHMVGKWDAGMATPEHTPFGRGFDTWLGYYQHSNSYWRKDSALLATGEIDSCLDSMVDFAVLNSTYRGGVQDAVSLSDACMNDTEADPGCYEEHLFKQRAVEVIQSHNPVNPLFLLYSSHLVHVPLQVPRSYLKRIDELVASSGGKPFDTSGRRYYNAMVLYLDDTIAEIVQALKQQNMWNNTLLVFASDNGGPIYENGAASNYPLKGGKFSDWEGGVRTNAFLSGGFVPQEKRGTTFSGVMSIADWYGTFCELAGADAEDHSAAAANLWLQDHKLPTLSPVDSVAQWGYVLNNSNGRPGALHLSEQAVLRWPFKLVVGDQVYSRYTGHLYPNCSTVHGLHTDQGPNFEDFKVLDAHIKWAFSKEKQDQLQWVEHCGTGCLFNVQEDPTEAHDLAGNADYRHVLDDLQATLSSLNTKLFTPDRGESSINACTLAVDHGSYLGPFVDVDDWYTPLPHEPTLVQRLKRKMKKAAFRAVGNPIVKKTLTKTTELVWPVLRYPFLETKAFRLDECIVSNETHALPVVI